MTPCTGTSWASKGSGPEMFSAYAKDALQRMVLTLDTLRERGNIDLAHETAARRRF